MSDERFLVTGAMGCLGAWTVRLLLDEGADIVTFDVSTDPGRLRLLASDEELSRVRAIAGDITDGEAVGRAVADEGVTHVIHLAALQVPFCRADAVLGARVNVVGTVNLFEAVLAARDRVRGFAYASSAAVFGPPDAYPGGRVADDSTPLPTNLYGVYKLANEGTGAVYDREHGLGSVALRPFVVYGLGRDQGMTSTPTVGMLAAAAGQPYRINFGGDVLYHFAPDAARAFIAAARAEAKQALSLNLGGTRASMARVVAAIERAAPEAAGLVTYDDAPLAVPSDVDAAGLEQLAPGLSHTPLDDGVAQTVDGFRRLLADGLVKPPGASSS